MDELKPRKPSPRSGLPPPPPRWKKGESGNPKGRPPNPLSLTNKLRERLGQVAPPDVVNKYFKEGTKGKTWLDIYVEAGLYAATDKSKMNGTAFKEIYDRIEGKIKEIMPEPPAPPIEEQQADPYKQAVAILKALVEKGILPPDLFAKFSPGNGDGERILS